MVGLCSVTEWCATRTLGHKGVDCEVPHRLVETKPIEPMIGSTYFQRLDGELIDTPSVQFSKGHICMIGVIVRFEKHNS